MMPLGVGSMVSSSLSDSLQHHESNQWISLTSYACVVLTRQACICNFLDSVRSYIEPQVFMSTGPIHVELMKAMSTDDELNEVETEVLADHEGRPTQADQQIITGAQVPESVDS